MYISCLITAKRITLIETHFLDVTDALVKRRLAAVNQKKKIEKDQTLIGYKSIFFAETIVTRKRFLY